jgi:hypothetical protein
VICRATKFPVRPAHEVGREAAGRQCRRAPIGDDGRARAAVRSHFAGADHARCPTDVDQDLDGGWRNSGHGGARNRSGETTRTDLRRAAPQPWEDAPFRGRWSRRLPTAEVEHFTIPAVGCRLAIVSWLRKRTHGRPASTPVAAPDPGEGAWLRRSPAGGWSLTLKQRHQGHHQSCVSLAEAAGLIAEQDDVSSVYLWSDARHAFMSLEPGSLAPLLEELRHRPAS